MTFSQCLNHLMEKHSLTVSHLAALIGVRTGLRRLLATDSTEAMRKLIFNHIVEHNLFTPHERMLLSRSLEVSRIGMENYKFDRIISNILAGTVPSPSAVLQTTSGSTLMQRLEVLKDARQVEILCVNCCFRTMVEALKPLFADPDANISMSHCVISKAFSRTSADVVSVIYPFLFDRRYKPFNACLSADASITAVGGNLLLIRYQIDNTSHQMFFVLMDQHVAHELPNADEADLFGFYSEILQSRSMHLLPMLEDRKRYSDFSSLCMTFLNHELNRATYTISSDICFQQIPSSICVEALRDKALIPPDKLEELIRRVLPIHEQRYHNQFGKKKPTCRIMTISGCKRFLKTGRSSDHFFAFRDFTPKERQRIFREMIDKAKDNPNFTPLLFKDENFIPYYHLVCYDKLGVSLDESGTDYDLSNGYPSIFLTFPEFTKQFLDYYQQTLMAEKCYSREESMQIFEHMLKRFEQENGL